MEQIMIQLTREVNEKNNDPLLQLAGVFESDITDISERHDEYIGDGLRKGDDLNFTMLR